MKQLVIRRSAIKMWLVAVLAVPFVLYGADVLLRQRFVGQVLDLIHPDGDLPSIETRDLAWAWVFVIVGGGLAIWGLKELILPRKVLEAGERGMSLRVGGPFSQAVVIPWSVIRAVRATRASDDGDIFPVVTFEFAPGQIPRGLPLQPWGARWVSRTTLAISAQDWDRSASRAVEEIEAIRPKVLTGKARYRPDPAEEMFYEPFEVPALEEIQDPRPTGTGAGAVPLEAPAPAELGEPAHVVDRGGPAPNPPLSDVGDAPPAAHTDTEAGGPSEESVPTGRKPLEPVEPPTPPAHVVVSRAQPESDADLDASERIPIVDDATAAAHVASEQPSRHWSTLGVDELGSSDWAGGEAELPKSRFTTSHWIILDEPEDVDGGATDR